MRSISRKVIGWLWIVLLALAAAAIYSARTDIEPYGRRLAAMEWRTFGKAPLPLDVIPQIYDMGIVDADGDGRLDIYAINHNYRQVLWLATPDGKFRDVVGAWHLDQSTALPGIEQSMTAPIVDKPGLYVYWLGDTLHVQFHGIDKLGPAKVTMRFFNVLTIVKNEAIVVRESVDKSGAIPQTRLDLTATRDGRLVIFSETRGTPVTVSVDAAWAAASTFVGAEGIVPRPYAGMSDNAAAPARQACPSCLSFEMTPRDRHSMAWSDLNHDGILDVFINRGALGGGLRDFPQSVRDQVSDEMLVSTAPGRFVDRAHELGFRKRDCSGRHVRWVDYDRDGLLDLFINCLDRGHAAGVFPKQFYRQGIDHRFEDVAATVKLDLPTHEIIDLAWFDTDGDDAVDLLTHEDTGIYLYRYVDGVFVRKLVHRPDFVRAAVAGLRGNTTDYWQFDGKLSVADFDNNGSLDVFVASKHGNVLLVNDGRGGFRSVRPASLGLPEASVAATWVDYDNDGSLDLHVVPDGLYRQVSPGRFERTDLLALPAKKYQAAIVNWFDRYNSGKLDVTIALQENAALWRWWERLYKSGDVKGRDDRFKWPVLAYRNLSPARHWLQLQLIGKAGNPEAIGAKVLLKTAAGRRLQQVGANEGSYLSQGHYRLSFGLGADAGPVELELVWPDGTHQTIRDVAVDRLLKLQQPA